MSTDKGQFAVGRTFAVPLKVMLGMRGLPVFVGAEDADIEIEARVFEVVRIAAVEGRLLFRSEDEPHVIVTFVAI